LVQLLDPELIVVAGGLVDAGEVILAPVRAALASRGLGAASRPEVPVVAAALGHRAGAVGAAILACPNLVDPGQRAGIA
ncbi:MAG: ROK family protein, partial [Acidimicrobiales bacterium]